LAKDNRKRDTPDTVQAIGELLAGFEENLNALVAANLEAQARAAGLDEATIAKVRRHSRCREQWRWN
jgi:hypothetical protein